MGALVALLLVMAMSVGALLLIPLPQRPGSQVTPTPTSPGVHMTPTAPTTPATPTPGTSETTPTPAPGVTPGPQPGPPGVSNPAYWDKILGTQPGVKKVESVSFAHIMDTGSLQALVTVRYTGTDARLDVYVFTNITSAHPKQLFKLTGLVKGEASISGYNTVMTAQVDQNSSINKGESLSAMKPDLFREFDWSSEEGTMVQTAFPGIFPDLTRWQAEVDQAAVSQGQESWKRDAVKTTQKMIAALLTGRKETSATKLVSGGGTGDLTAVVKVTFPPSGSSALPVTQVTLSRLEGNPNGIWQVTAVGSNWVFVSTPKSGTTIPSPLMVTGFGPQFEGQIGVVYILDHLYQKIQGGDNFAMGSGGFSPPSKFSLEVRYTSSFQGGAQEGIVEVVHTGGATFDFGAVMVKVLLSA